MNQSMNIPGNQVTFTPAAGKSFEYGLIPNQIRIVAVKLEALDALFLRAMEGGSGADDLYTGIQEFVVDAAKELHALSLSADKTMGTLNYGKRGKK